MRTKLDLDDADDRSRESRTPYPSWDAVLSRLQTDRTRQPQASEVVPTTREWHDLVADMIIGR